MLKDKVPPHHDEAEQATLGAMLLDNDSVDTAVQYLRADDFYSNANRRVFNAILSLYNQGRQKADIMTVEEELRKAGDLDAAGGTAYVAGLTNVVPSSANIDYYARIVQDRSLRRALIRIAAEVSSRSCDESVESRQVLEECQQKFFDLGEERQTVSYKSAKELVPETMDFIEKRYHSKEAYTGVPSGFDDLDNLTSGFQPSELVIIGARPSVGKTALALNMAANITLKAKKPAAFFSLEMSQLALGLRILSAEARIDAKRIQTGFIQPRDFASLMDAAGRLYDAPLYVVDIPNMKLLNLRTAARRLRVQQQVEIIFIDYLSLITSENYQIPRHEQVAEVSRSLKSLARELDIPVVALSQVSREVEKNRGERPRLSDIRESGAIEQDADLVMFLHRKPEDKDRKEGGVPQNEAVPMELIIAKQRNGPVGTIEMAFTPRFAAFSQVDKSRQ
ncbi:replicative DNA helicase [Spirochaetia bacterium]|nr:replicative DNA helicase [Spirochaetia bacterium]